MSTTNALRSLSPDVCRELLLTANIGRLILTADALPTAMTVSYVLAGDVVILRTDSTTVSPSENGTVVAFQVDFVDPARHEGWSVVVTGLASVLVDPVDIRKVEALEIPAWISSSATTYIRLPTDLIKGRVMGEGSADDERAPI